MRILVPVDHSINCESALAALERLSLIGAARVTLLNVVPQADALLPFSISGDSPGKEQEELATRSIWLEGLAKPLREKLPNCHIDYAIRFGHPKETIPEEAYKLKSDLVIMGSRGRKGVERLLLGSVSHAVLEYSSCPVMIVKGELDESFSFKKILITFDGSVYARDTIAWLSRTAMSPGTKVRVLMVIPEVQDAKKRDISEHQAGLLKEQWTRIRERSFEMMEDVALSLGEKIGYENISVDALPGDPKTKIVSAADDFGAELIVMGSHGRSGLERILIGSVSLNVAYSANCPVLVVKRLNKITLNESDDFEAQDKAPKRSRIYPQAEERPPFTMM